MAASQPDRAAAEVGTRERIVTEAIRLFAERGFKGTTVGEIEQAAGLAPRSGGLYKHFRSKEELLAAAADRNVHAIETLRSMLDFRPLGDLRAELTLVARWTLSELRAERPLIKIVQKDGDQFPELVKLVSDRVIKSGHEAATEVMGLLMSNHGVPVADPGALASIALASLVGRDLEEMLFDHEPGGLDEDQYIEAWVEMWLTYVRGAGLDRTPVANETAR